MAQPIHCDAEGEHHLADVLVSRIANGETLAWCDPHYIDVCRAIIEAVDAAEREAADADALGRLGDVAASLPVDGDAVPAADAAMPTAGTPPDEGAWSGGILEADPLDAIAATDVGFPTSGDSSPAATPPAEPPTKRAGGRKRTEPHSGATPSTNARPEPSTALVGDPGEAGTAPR